MMSPIPLQYILVHKTVGNRMKIPIVLYRQHARSMYFNASMNNC